MAKDRLCGRHTISCLFQHCLSGRVIFRTNNGSSCGCKIYLLAEWKHVKTVSVTCFNIVDPTRISSIINFRGYRSSRCYDGSIRERSRKIGNLRGRTMKAQFRMGFCSVVRGLLHIRRVGSRAWTEHVLDILDGHQKTVSLATSLVVHVRHTSKMFWM